MNKRKILFLGIQILFCALLIYWFYTNSYIRPYTILHPYKEIICALLVILLIYFSYFILSPFYFIRNSYFKSYIFLSLLVTGIVSITELLIVKADIIKCIGLNDSLIIQYLLNILFLIFLRDLSFFLFFSVLKLYLQTKANALLEKKEALKDIGLVLLLPSRGNPISININYVSYFSQNKNNTFIHSTFGKPIPIYSSLNYLKSYLTDYCLRINKDIIITFTNIISYDRKRVVVVDGKTHTKKSFIFYKKSANDILLTLRKKVPELEEKNDIELLKNKNDSINDDKKNKIDNIKVEILEEIRRNPGIDALKLADILQEKIKVNNSESTIRRRLRELKNTGKIEYKGSNKTGGYYIV
jgi:hypothetical protein